MIYLDYAATTPIDKEILAKYNDVESKFFANTTSMHLLGQKSNYMYEDYSKDTLELLRCPNHEIIYTSNATEANNIAIYGIANKYKSGTIITTQIEHPSVFEVIKSLADRFNIVYLDTTPDGTIDVSELKTKMTKDVILVSIMWVNNIVGSVLPIKDIIKVVKDYPKAKLHVDAVQGLGKIKPDFNLSDIDMFTFSTHKIYGPKGVGALVKKKNLALEKYMYGSHSQFDLRPGTFDLALVACTNLAIKKAITNLDKEYEYVKELYMYLYQGLSNIKQVVINSNINNSSYYCLSISIFNNDNFVPSETILHYLEQYAIYVSIGSSCSSKLAKPEKTILAITNDINRSKSAIRISLSYLTKKEELDVLLNALRKYGEQYV